MPLHESLGEGSGNLVLNRVPGDSSSIVIYVFFFYNQDSLGNRDSQVVAHVRNPGRGCSKADFQVPP